MKDDKQDKPKGRPPVATGELVDAPEYAGNSEMVASEALARTNLDLIDKQFGSDLPYDRGRIVDECKFYMLQSTKAAVELGKRLIVLKEHEPHGEFTKSLESIGVVPRTARRLMQATVKFQDKTVTVIALGIGKLYELMTEDDEVLKGLESGGTLAGLDLDKIDRMTLRDLRKALRERDESIEAKDKVLEKKDKKLNELDEKLNKREHQLEAWEGKVDDLNISITTAAGLASNALSNLDLMRDKMMFLDLDEDHRAAGEERLGRWKKIITQNNLKK